MSHTPQLLFFRFFAAEGKDLRQFNKQCIELDEEQEFFSEWSVQNTSAPDGSYLDVLFHWDFRSQQPLIRTENIYTMEWFDRIICRANSGFWHFDHTVDGIEDLSPDYDRFLPEAWQPCRYGFDRVEVLFHEPQSLPPPWEQQKDRWILRGEGSYLTLNTQPISYWNEGRSPHRHASAYQPIVSPEPWDVLAMLQPRPIACIEWFFAGRMVHRAFTHEGTFEEVPEDGLWHTCLDGWDNCLWPPFLQAMQQQHRERPAAVYARDRGEEETLDEEPTES